MERRTRSYLQLIKPGITLSNTMTAAAGFMLAASHFGFSWSRFIGAIGGVALVIASACVANNILDRDIDARMKRTNGREIAAGKISPQVAAVYAGVLGLVGFYLLMTLTNNLTAMLGAISYVWYVVIYGAAKRSTPLSTIIGAVCGALPPMAGYVAVTGHIDATAWVLFWVLMVWQLPHFYAISIWRADDYREVGLPVWSVLLGVESTKAQILFWTVAFVMVAPLLTVTSAAGTTYLAVMVAVGIYWVTQGFAYYHREDDVRWAKRMFGISLVALLVLCAAMSVGGYLP